jgi:hypothetical protein
VALLSFVVLDDNTYTNKTWAEVSGLKIKEIHLMEVEFLSNMRYSLFTSENDWHRWHLKLGKFGSAINQFIQSASKPPPIAAPTLPDVRVDSVPAGYRSWNSPVSSVTLGVNTPTQMGLPYPATNSLTAPRPYAMANNNLIGSHTYESLPAPAALKRMREYEEIQKPPKRHASMLELSRQAEARNTDSQFNLPSASQPSHLHLPTLHTSIPNALPDPLVPHFKSTIPAPNTRAMSLVYPSSHLSTHQLQRPQASFIPAIQTSIPPQNLLAVDPPQLSPFGYSSASSSPTGAPAFANAYSPSFFLQQRSSPYRPVRRVQTLLVPPPIQSIQDAPTMVGASQMQYHLLGHPDQRHIGHVPYVNYEAWPPNQPSVWPSQSHPQGRQ